MEKIHQQMEDIKRRAATKQQTQTADNQNDEKQQKQTGKMQQQMEEIENQAVQKQSAPVVDNLKCVQNSGNSLCTYNFIWLFWCIIYKFFYF